MGAWQGRCLWYAIYLSEIHCIICKWQKLPVSFGHSIEFHAPALSSFILKSSSLLPRHTEHKGRLDFFSSNLAPVVYKMLENIARSLPSHYFKPFAASVWVSSLCVGIWKDLNWQPNCDNWWWNICLKAIWKFACAIESGNSQDNMFLSCIFTRTATTLYFVWCSFWEVVQLIGNIPPSQLICCFVSHRRFIWDYITVVRDQHLPQA